MVADLASNTSMKFNTVLMRKNEEFLSVGLSMYINFLEE